MDLLHLYVALVGWHFAAAVLLLHKIMPRSLTLCCSAALALLLLDYRYIATTREDGVAVVR